MITTFWKWLILGTKFSPSGIRNVLNFYLLAHAALATIAVSLIKSDPFTFAGKALFPAASILIGMSMAWTTRASTILQSKELREALFKNDRSAEDYIYGFQLAILVVITMVTFVAIMAGGGLDVTIFGGDVDATLSGFWMYFLLSVALRECWGVVNFSNMLSLLDYTRTK